MDWQLAITLNVMALSAFSILFSLMRWRFADVPWLLIHAAILALGALGLYTGFEQTGTVLGAIFFPFVLLPGYLVLRSNRAAARGDYASSARYLKVAATLHPSAKLRFSSAVTRAFTLPDADSIAGALASLKATATETQRNTLDVTAARLLARWDDVLSITRRVKQRQPELLEYEVRALGELGHPEDMVRAYQEIKRHLYGDALRNCQLFILAFCGKPDAVALIAHNKQAALHPEFAAYWQAIAKVHAPGLRAAGQSELRHLAETATLENAERAARYALAASMRPLPDVSVATAAEADAIAKRWVENAPLERATLLMSPLTLALLIANGIMFALEYAYGGPEDTAALYRLGALWPGSLADPAEWWRVPAAMFLHFGWPHLILNMVSLALLGRMVEAAFGTLRMGVIYVLGGLGSMAMVVGLMQARVLQADFLVGASGAIMALIGAWTGRTLRQYLGTRDTLDRRQIAALAIVMLGQFALDLSVPQVSFTAHATGFFIGLALGLALSRRTNSATAG